MFFLNNRNDSSLTLTDPGYYRLLTPPPPPLRSRKLFYQSSHYTIQCVPEKERHFKYIYKTANN